MRKGNNLKTSGSNVVANKEYKRYKMKGERLESNINRS